MRYSILILFGFGIISLTFSPEAFPAEYGPSVCGGVSESCSCGACNYCWCCDGSGCVNGGNCVWYTWNRRCQAGEYLPWCTDAKTWNNYAISNGWPVCAGPIIGAVAVREQGTWGHVGYVVGISGDTVYTDEQGCGSCGTSYNVARSRSYWDGGFIYRHNQSCDLGISLVRLSAKGSIFNIEVLWETSSEIDVAGFNILRSTDEFGAYEEINPRLISPQGDPVTGALYTYDDETVSPGLTYYYKLETVELTGQTYLYGPVSASTIQLCAALPGGTPDRLLPGFVLTYLLLLALPAIFAGTAFRNHGEKERGRESGLPV